MADSFDFSTEYFEDEKTPNLSEEQLKEFEGQIQEEKPNYYCEGLEDPDPESGPTPHTEVYESRRDHCECIICAPKENWADFKKFYVCKKCGKEIK